MGREIRKPASHPADSHPDGKLGVWETGGLVTCFLGLGSNLGKREKNIELALQYLDENEQIKLEKISSIIETDPVLPQGAKSQALLNNSPRRIPPLADLTGQEKFLNAVAKIKTSLPPQSLLTALKQIEKRIGRRPAPRFSPRVIDLDILLYGDRKIDEENLKIPHPQIQERKFVRKLLGEICPPEADEISRTSQEETHRNLLVSLAK